MLVAGARGERDGAEAAGEAREGIEGIEGMKPEWRGAFEDCRRWCAPPRDGLDGIEARRPALSCSSGGEKTASGGGMLSRTSDGGRFFDRMSGASTPLALDLRGDVGAQLVSASSSIFRSRSSAGVAWRGVANDVRGREGVGGGRKGFVGVEGVVGVLGRASGNAGVELARRWTLSTDDVLSS
jgi:hypothetical protein